MKRIYLISLICLLGLAANAVAQNASAVDQAAAAAAAGRTDEAIQSYNAALQQDPNNVAALAGLSQLLQSEGKWRDAVPMLEKLVQLDPQNATALYQLGRIRSWQTGGRTQALALLQRACDASNHAPEPCAAYADVLSWGDQTRAEAILQLKDTLASHPDAVDARVKLGQILSWNEATRAQGMQVFDEGLKLDPKSVDLLIASAEVLSWHSSNRAESIARYDRALAIAPDDPRALTGKAQMLAWQGHRDEALVLYRQALAKDPKNAAALRGEAEIMNWKGQFVEARTLAQEAHEGAPTDPRANLELARAYVGLQKYTAARQAIAEVNGNPTPDFLDVRHEVQRALGSYVEFGYTFRQEPTAIDNNNVEYHRFGLAVSTPINSTNRLTFLLQPTLYNSFAQGVNTSYFGASLDSTLSDRVTTHVQAGATLFENVPVNGDGSLGVNFKPVPSTTLKFNFQRQPVEDSLLSIQGQQFGGQFFGQVYSNLADLGVSYDAPHKMDLSLDYTDGAYTGRGLDINRRYSVDAQVGKSLRGDQPYIRIGYYGDFTSFDHDADFQAGLPLSRFTGGYFSPTKYLLNEGVLTITHRFGKNVRWGMSGAAGVQNSETNTTAFSNAQFADNFETHLFWRITPMNELKFGYEYLNTFNAFQRNLFRFSWRHYF